MNIYQAGLLFCIAEVFIFVTALLLWAIEPTTYKQAVIATHVFSYATIGGLLGLAFVVVVIPDWYRYLGRL